MENALRQLMEFAIAADDQRLCWLIGQVAVHVNTHRASLEPREVAEVFGSSPADRKSVV